MGIIEPRTGFIDDMVLKRHMAIDLEYKQTCA